MLKTTKENELIHLNKNTTVATSNSCNVSRDIWMFREPRSGSTGITSFLACKLNRIFYFVDTRPDWQNAIGDHNLLYNTHNFTLLSKLDSYDNPFILRCYRKNKFEQFLSLVFALTIGKSINIGRNTASEDIEKLQACSQKKIKVPLDYVQRFLLKKKEEDDLWDQYSCKYDNYTIYYETLTEPIVIPELGLLNVKINSHTEKLPDYKRNVFENYDQIKRWFTEVQ